MYSTQFDFICRLCFSWHIVSVGDQRKIPNQIGSQEDHQCNQIQRQRLQSLLQQCTCRNMWCDKYFCSETELLLELHRMNQTSQISSNCKFDTLQAVFSGTSHEQYLNLVIQISHHWVPIISSLLLKYSLFKILN